jgi:hypothetical protein
MSKRKSSRKVTTVAPNWSDLEEAFFAAAPPDGPEPAPEDLRFDDLSGDPPAGQAIPRWFQRAMAEAGRVFDPARWPVWVVLATLLVLVGVSAAVFH